MYDPLDDPHSPCMNCPDAYKWPNCPEHSWCPKPSTSSGIRRMPKELKMGYDYVSDTITFALIAICEAILMIQKEYDAPVDFGKFYQINAVINEAVKRASKKTGFNAG